MQQASKDDGSWSNCVRKCLQDYDDQVCDKCDSEGGRGICAAFAHANCFIMCEVHPDDPIWDGNQL